MPSLKIVQPGKLASSACRPIHYLSINDGVIGAKEEKRSKRGKKEKNKWDDWRCESVNLVHGSPQQGITSCKRLFSSTNSSWNMDAKRRSFRWLTLDHTRSAQRRCCISESLPRLAELVPIGAKGLPRLVMSPHPFCLGLLQLLFSVWLRVFNLFFHTKRRN